MQDTSKLNEWKKKIFSIGNQREFRAIAIAMFKEHYEYNPVYRKYVSMLYPDMEPDNISHESEIPFLPIEFFKTQKVLLNYCCAEDYFESSGTTGANSSKHWISDFDLYDKSCIKGFSCFWGEPTQYTYLALLPNYMQQKHSSLIRMVNTLMSCSNSEYNGFYFDEYDCLIDILKKMEESKKPTILLGVSYALLDLAQKWRNSSTLRYVKIIETGGMKGRRKEIVREELHKILKDSFCVANIYSEYGMCELLSQSYLKEDGSFQSPKWKKVLLRSTANPLQMVQEGEMGGINVIDLANMHSCPFIATQDLGKVHKDGCFEVYGRFDGSDVRGCNLMVV